ncbi:hypothetical protein V1512DRAFT_248640 [Lipomyces arxii]|uniref:uncharacterized protein n=1 Tax=Lipomyces arxii TaxID=56418 RepID=UPI0034CFF5F5
MPVTRSSACEMLLRQLRLSILPRAPRPVQRLNFSSAIVRRAIEPPLGKAVKVKTGAADEAAKTVKSRKRLQALVDRLPARLRPYAEKLLGYPGSYIFTFMLIHELTAILPLFGLVYLFDYLDFMPSLSGAMIDKGLEFYKKAVPESALPASGEAASKFLLHGAAAYAIVKMLFPIRLVFSIAVTPMFARWSVIPLVNRLSIIRKALKSPKKGMNFDDLPKRMK